MVCFAKLVPRANHEWRETGSFCLDNVKTIPVSRVRGGGNHVKCRSTYDDLWSIFFSYSSSGRLAARTSAGCRIVGSNRFMYRDVDLQDAFFESENLASRIDRAFVVISDVVSMES
jgi:hypothetical protein